MARDELSIVEFAGLYARTAQEAYAATGRYLRSLPPDAWDEPTGCEKWTMRVLAGHVAGEAVWFPNLVRGVTRGEAPLPDSLYQELKALPLPETAGRIEEAAAAIQSSVDEADPDQLRQTVDLGFTKMPLWRATSISAFEAVLHNWDARAGREDRATIPTAWAKALAGITVEFAPEIAHQDGVDAVPGVYLLRVGDGIGSVTITSRDGKVTAEEGAAAAPEVLLDLRVDQYVRLLAGRLDLASPEGRDLRIEGDRARAEGLNRIFAGVANG